jgi:hypothetical protein
MESHNGIRNFASLISFPQRGPRTASLPWDRAIAVQSDGAACSAAGRIHLFSKRFAATRTCCELRAPSYQISLHALFAFS